MISWPQTREQFVAAVKEQSTPRALAGLFALSLLLVALGLTALSESIASKQSELESIRRELSLQTNISQDTEWIETAARLEQSFADLESKYWSGATPGIIAAEIQSFLNEAASDAELARVQIIVQAEPDILSDGTLVYSISFRAFDSDGQFLAFFQSLAREQRLIIPTSFEWRRPNRQLIMTLIAPASDPATNQVEG